MGSSDERKTPCHHERSNAEQNKNRSAAPRRGSQWQCRRQCHCCGISAAGPLRLAAPVRRGRSRGLALDRAHSQVRRLSLGRGRAESAEAEDRPNGFHGDRTASDRPSTTTAWSTPPSVRSTASISCSPMQSLRDPTRVCADRAAVILASGPPPAILPARLCAPSQSIWPPKSDNWIGGCRYRRRHRSSSPRVLQLTDFNCARSESATRAGSSTGPARFIGSARRAAFASYTGTTHRRILPRYHCPPTILTERRPETELCSAHQDYHPDRSRNNGLHALSAEVSLPGRASEKRCAV